MRIDANNPSQVAYRPTVEAQVAEAVNAGWRIVSDGPSGVQLVGPKKMQALDKICLVVGLLTFWIYGIGLFFMALAALDYWIFTKAPTKFIARA